MQRGREEGKAETTERVIHAFYYLPTYSKVTVSSTWFVTRGRAAHFSNFRQQKALTGAWTKVQIVS